MLDYAPKGRLSGPDPIPVIAKINICVQIHGHENSSRLREAELDPDDRDFLAQIREHGWFATRVFDPEKKEPDFTYSTGFFHGLGYPEIIVFSLPKQVSRDILWDIYRDIREGNAPKPEARLSGIFGNHQAVLLPVSRGTYAE